MGGDTGGGAAAAGQLTQGVRQEHRPVQHQKPGIGHFTVI